MSPNAGAITAAISAAPVDAIQRCARWRPRTKLTRTVRFAVSVSGVAMNELNGTGPVASPIEATRCPVPSAMS